MGNTHTTLSGLFTNIANAIRSKNGSTQPIVADNFPTEIENLRTGFDYNNQNVTSIADYEFKNCEDLRSVDCYNLTSIGDGAFENCSNLKTVVLYDGVETVGENVFKGCSNLTIYCDAESKPVTWHENWNPDNCEVVWNYLLVETWDISATSEDSVTAKLYNDVQQNGRYSLVVSGNGDMKCYNEQISVPWHDYAFVRIASVKINNGITSIGDYAFAICTKIISVAIPYGVTSIGKDAFASCKSLISITIPDSVVSIGEYAIYNCVSLISINYTGTIAQWNTIAFHNNWNRSTPDYTIHCTDGDIAKDGTITYRTTE